MTPSHPSPPLWRVRGYRAGLEWSPADGLYTASLAEIPGCFARGASRTETLRRLAAAIDRAGEEASAAPCGSRRRAGSPRR